MYSPCVNIAKIDIFSKKGKIEILEIMKNSIEKNNLPQMLKLKYKFEYFGYFYSIYETPTYDSNKNLTPSHIKNNDKIEMEFNMIVQKFMIYFDVINICKSSNPFINTDNNVIDSIKTTLLNEIDEFNKRTL